MTHNPGVCVCAAVCLYTLYVAVNKTLRKGEEFRAHIIIMRTARCTHNRYYIFIRLCRRACTRGRFSSEPVRGTHCKGARWDVGEKNTYVSLIMNMCNACVQL